MSIENRLSYLKNWISGGSRSLSKEDLDDYFAEGNPEVLKKEGTKKVNNSTTPTKIAVNKN